MSGKHARIGFVVILTKVAHRTSAASEALLQGGLMSIMCSKAVFRICVWMRQAPEQLMWRHLEHFYAQKCSFYSSIIILIRIFPSLF